MATAQRTYEQLLLELEELTFRLQEAEDTLEAIRSGSVDALVVASAPGLEQLFTLEGADRVYRIFLESISEGAVTLTGEGLILYANEAAGRLLSTEPSSLVGGHLRTPYAGTNASASMPCSNVRGSRRCTARSECAERRAVGRCTYRCAPSRTAAIS